MLSENELHRGPERPERERRAKEIFDFTGDDPGVCVPPEVNEALRALLRILPDFIDNRHRIVRVR